MQQRSFVGLAPIPNHSSGDSFSQLNLFWEKQSMFCSNAILILQVSSMAAGHPRISQRQPSESVFLADLHVLGPCCWVRCDCSSASSSSMEFPLHFLTKKAHSALTSPSQWSEGSFNTSDYFSLMYPLVTDAQLCPSAPGLRSADFTDFRL